MIGLTLEILGVLLVHEAGEVTTIVEDHIEGVPALEGTEGLFNAPEVLLLSLALPSIDRDTSCSDTGNKIRDQIDAMNDHHSRSSSMVLGGKNILREM